MDAETWFQLARAEQLSGDLEAAGRAYASAVRVGEASGNANFEALFSCGCLQQALNDTAAAEQSFRKALEVGAPPLGPAAVRRELDAQHNWGMTLLGLERFEEAGLVFEEVVNQDPNADESWASLGVTMAALDQTEAAIACQRQVLTIRAMREKKITVE